MKRRNPDPHSYWNRRPYLLNKRKSHPGAVFCRVSSVCPEMNKRGRLFKRWIAAGRLYTMHGICLLSASGRVPHLREAMQEGRLFLRTDKGGKNLY
ncbi:hypothetical protein HOU22_gp10 [Escherichia phage C130_2]|uniref:Uncharacterized protein n=1 Tax=Escherichia phage C130_2 TaxID=2234093 RepID=A0A384ZRN2_9CAUD|nr:hypothetical protein HOU22_gp10 [Escherichia phage C130_2]AXC34312.1 hypothetical protein 1302_0002 [Escherichia phage C130_2]